MARVLVVDDSREFRKVVCDWIASQPGLELAGEVVDGSDAVAAVERERPDLVLMDAAMSDMTGFEATRRIKSVPDAPPVGICPDCRGKRKLA
jgi:chemotaxis response regulator CheB